MFLNLKFLLFLVLVSTQLTFPNHFLYPCDEKQADRGKFRLWLEGLTLTKNLTCQQPRKIENLIKKKNGRFKERKQLRLLLQWLKHRLRKSLLAKYHKRTKEPNDETHKDTVCLLALIWRKLHKDPKIKRKLTRSKQIGYSCSLQKRYAKTEKRRNKNYGSCKNWTHSLCVIRPRSARWTNGPDKIVKSAEAWYHADGGGYLPPQKAEEDNTLHYLHNSTNIADFNIVAIIHLKHFQAHTVFTRISVNKNICLFLDCCRADVFSAKRLILSLCYINVASVNPVLIFCFYYRRRS